jgi:hypothetical protein
MYYKKIIIRSVKDLPKRQGLYFMQAKKNSTLKDIHALGYGKELKDIWMVNVKYYLQPVSYKNIVEKSE